MSQYIQFMRLPYVKRCYCYNIKYYTRRPRGADDTLGFANLLVLYICFCSKSTIGIHFQNALFGISYIVGRYYVQYAYMYVCTRNRTYSTGMYILSSVILVYVHRYIVNYYNGLLEPLESGQLLQDDHGDRKHESKAEDQAGED